MEMNVVWAVYDPLDVLCCGVYHQQWYFSLGGVPALGKLKGVVDTLVQAVAE